MKELFKKMAPCIFGFLTITNPMPDTKIKVPGALIHEICPHT